MTQLTWCLKMKLNLGFCKIRWICKVLRDLITFRLIEIETENKTTKDSRTKLEIGMKKCRQMQICGRPGTNIYIYQKYLCSPTVRHNFVWYFLKNLADLMVNGGRMTLHLHACCSFFLAVRYSWQKFNICSKQETKRQNHREIIATLNLLKCNNKHTSTAILYPEAYRGLLHREFCNNIND